MKETFSLLCLSVCFIFLALGSVPVWAQNGGLTGPASENARDQRWVKQGTDILFSYPAHTRIGIGTDAPVLPFEVVGQSRFYSRVGFDSEVLFGNNILFELGTLTSAGNLGLGTRSPANRLEVVGSSMFDGNTRFLQAVRVEGPADFLSTASFSNDIAVNGRSSFEGEVAMGAGLNVNGPSQFNSSVTVGGPVSFTEGVSFANGFWSADGRLVIGRPSIAENYTLQVKGSADAEELYLDGIPIKEAVAVWQSPGGDDIVYNEGNVGIGTSDPDPQYRLSVNGKVRSKEVVVESDWADFVFDKDYSLPSLEQVEAFILSYGHLPGIPSAAQVKRQGVALGEMQKLLLQKVEELVLYAIRQQRQIEILQQRLDLQNEIFLEYKQSLKRAREE